MAACTPQERINIRLQDDGHGHLVCKRCRKRFSKKKLQWNKSPMRYIPDISLGQAKHFVQGCALCAVLLKFCTQHGDNNIIYLQPLDTSSFCVNVFYSQSGSVISVTAEEHAKLSPLRVWDTSAYRRNGWLVPLTVETATRTLATLDCSMTRLIRPS